MRTIVLERWAWAVTVIALGFVADTWHRIARPAQAPVPTIWPVSPPARPITSDSLGVLTARIVESDVFRLDRRPAALAYGSSPDTLANRPVPAPAPPRPALVLVGIVGPPWRALVDGIPGHDGSVLLHAGQVMAGLRVREVTATGASISAADTTWHLAIKRTW